jgi:hypothetical protein
MESRSRFRDFSTYLRTAEMGSLEDKAAQFVRRKSAEILKPALHRIREGGEVINVPGVDLAGVFFEQE